MNRYKRKRLISIALILLLLLAVGTAVYLYAKRGRLSPNMVNDGVYRPGTKKPAEDTPTDDSGDDEDKRAIFLNGKEYLYNEELTTFLILGTDDPEITETDTQGSEFNHSQADFLVLAVFNKDGSDCSLIQINRDTVCEIPVPDETGKVVAYETAQIALSHTYGSGLNDSCAYSAEAVSNLLYGVPIDNYLAVAMDAIPVMNDLVGGVTVKIENDFSNIDSSLVKGETVTLTGEQAVTFVRSRMSMADDPTNIARMGRQRTYMRALLSGFKAAMAKDPAFPLTVIAELSDKMVTDCPPDKLADYADKLSSVALNDIYTPEGESVQGSEFMEFHLDEESLQQFVLDTFYIPAED